MDQETDDRCRLIQSTLTTAFYSLLRVLENDDSFMFPHSLVHNLGNVRTEFDLYWTMAINRQKKT